MDRAHRIGQTKQVYVFRFITQVRNRPRSSPHSPSDEPVRMRSKSAYSNGRRRNLSWISLSFRRAGHNRRQRVGLVSLIYGYC